MTLNEFLAFTGCSDPKEKEFRSQCTIYHDTSCQFCEIVPMVGQTILGLLEEIKFQIGEDSLLYRESKFDVKGSIRKIRNFANNAMRNVVSNNEWQNLMDMKNPNQVFCTFDWVRAHEQRYPW